MDNKLHNQAMILAAGVGSRLDPLTSQLPKPLCPVLGKSVMEHIVDLCKMHNFTELVANTHVMADKISKHFKDSKKNFGVNLNLVYEPNLTGVAGGIRSCKKFLTNDVILVIMGDALTDVDLTSLYETHVRSSCPVTIGLKEVEDTSQYGVAVVNKDNMVISFQEKPKPNEAKSNLANTGIYLFNQNILNEIPPESEVLKYDVATDLFQKLMSKNIPMQGININSYWADIGTLKQYLQSIKDALEGRVRISVSCKSFEYGFIESGVIIDKSVKIQGKVYIGKNVKIGPNVVLNGSVYIEKDCVIDADSYINNSIIWTNSKIGKNVKIINSILGNNCTVSQGTQIISNSVWAPETTITNNTKPTVLLK